MRKIDPHNIHGLIGDLVTESRKTNGFKEGLINNPIETIEKFSKEKIKFNQGVSVVVEDQSDSNFIYLNIPRKVDLDSIELTEEELEEISGGTTFGCAIGAGLLLWAGTNFIEGGYTAFKDRLK